MFGLEFGGGLARPHVFAGGGAAGIGFLGADSVVPVRLVFVHESVVLLFGYHSPRLA
jgi:hypothetical protein